MTFQPTKLALAALVLALFGQGQAVAKDAIQATVDGNIYVFEENGNPNANGTYAIGTLKVFMIVPATEWPATLDPVVLDMAIKAIDKKPETKYTVPIRLRQAGGDLVLTPGPDTFNVDSAAWTDSSTIAVSVPQSILDDDSFDTDGTVLVANLQIEPTQPAKHLDTVTTIQIRAMLVHPAVTTCLRTVMFLSDNGVNTDVSSGGFKQKYKTTPSFSLQGTVPSQFLGDVLVVNTCDSPKEFDLEIVLDSAFAQKSPGDSVFVTRTANAASDNDALIDTFAELKVDKGDFTFNVSTDTDLCIGGLALPGKFSLWAKADIEYARDFADLAALELEEGATYDEFTATVRSVAATPCTGAEHPESEGQAATSTTLTEVCTNPCN